MQELVLSSSIVSFKDPQNQSGEKMIVSPLPETKNGLQLFFSFFSSPSFIHPFERRFVLTHLFPQ